MNGLPIIFSSSSPWPGRIKIILGTLGVLIGLFGGWRQTVERRHFQNMVASLTPDQFDGVLVTGGSTDTNITDTAGCTDFIAALRDLAHYSPNRPQYQREKELSVIFRLPDGRRHSLRVCFRADSQDRNAYVYGSGGTYRGTLLYRFVESHGLL